MFVFRGGDKDSFSKLTFGGDRNYRLEVVDGLSHPSSLYVPKIGEIHQLLQYLQTSRWTPLEDLLVLHHILFQ